MPNNPHIPFKTRCELAAECGIHHRTVSRRLKAICPDLKPRQLLCPACQKAFYQSYGWPSTVDIERYTHVSNGYKK